jgi:RNA polymerase sigma-70 factor, ECF subfamily
VELDEVDALFQAAGRGDFDAFASFYDRTAPAVFNHLHHVLGDTAAAERATVRVYVRVWRTAHTFDPAVLAGGAFLILTIHRELDGRDRRDDARCPRADHSYNDRLGVSSGLRG